MAWRDPVMDYCERLGADFWSEPLNAVSNGAFAIAAVAAFALWRRQPRADQPALALIALTATVGAGSFVFHTVATRGAMLFDVIPIAVFIYGYFFLALRRFFGLGLAAAASVTLLFGAGSYLLDALVHGLNGSVAYLPALGAMAGFATLLQIPSRESETRTLSRHAAARGLAMAALVFAASLSFRTMDRAVCGALPLGTHFLWHVLNAGVLWLLLRTAIIARANDAASS
jgi:hypothetical protein